MGRDTSGSDIDWTLLIDGSADPKHYDLFKKIGSVIEALAPKPEGPEGTFGKMVFSHALIHDIGGEDDTSSRGYSRNCPTQRFALTSAMRGSSIRL